MSVVLEMGLRCSWFTSSLTVAADHGHFDDGGEFVFSAKRFVPVRWIRIPRLGGRSKPECVPARDYAAEADSEGKDAPMKRFFMNGCLSRFLRSVKLGIAISLGSGVAGAGESIEPEAVSVAEPASQSDIYGNFDSSDASDSGLCDRIGCDEMGCEDFGGDSFMCRRTAPFPDKLGGDWHGWRTHFAESGITYAGDHVGIGYGVANGGVDRDARFGGHADSILNFDFGKLGFQEGLFLKIRSEYRYGESLSGATGTLLPSYVITDLPVVDNRDLYITNFLFTQMFSPRFGVFAGKLDTLDGDKNAFAHARGKDQFSNIAFVSAPIAFRAVPYSTLGTGLFYLDEDGEPLFALNILNPTDTTKTTGFSELFSQGVTFASEVRVPTRFAGLPGHQLLGGTYSTRDYVSLGQDPRIILPSVPVERQSGSWSLYYNFDQHLIMQPGSTKKGWGTFGRAGIADRESNPIEWFLSYGIGGCSPLANRCNDQFGAGWYIAGTSSALDPAIPAIIGPLGDGQGIETFYNYEVRPWMHVTADMQYIVPSRAEIDDALVLGLRTRIDF